MILCLAVDRNSSIYSRGKQGRFIFRIPDIAGDGLKQVTNRD